MNIKEISKKVAEFVENLLQEELNKEIVDNSFIENYQSELNDAVQLEEMYQENDNLVESYIDKDAIDEQTIKLLKSRGKN